MTNTTNTTNGMPAYKSTLNACVDLFFAIGASRGKDIIPSFSKAYAEDPDMALRIAQWVRDVRGGSGERKIYKDILQYLATEDSDACSALMLKTPELGRWDDLFALMDTPLETEALGLLEHGILVEKNALCAKWCPRKGKNAIKLRTHMAMSPKRYRKTLVNMTNVVETDMCAKNWDSINFEQIPSLASARYQAAFNKNAEKSYMKYKNGLVSGEKEIKAGAVYPYDIVKSVTHGDITVADAQWKALPNFMEGSTERVIPLVDVSGSMYTPVGGGGSTTCLDVATSLGLYISERNEGIFKDKFITFSSNPSFVNLTGNLSTRLNTMNRADWGMSTDIGKTFDLILDSATMYNVQESDMPTKLLILSDMQFDYCGTNNSSFVMESVKQKYDKAGYRVPDIVFWNLRSEGNVPVTFDSKGTALVSGFSPSLMKSVLACSDMTPIQMMKDTVCIERYDWSFAA